jgi:hypothetical protein
MYHSTRHNHSIGYEVLTAVLKLSSIFRDIMLCSTAKVNRRFGGASSDMKSKRNQHEAANK